MYNNYESQLANNIAHRVKQYLEANPADKALVDEATLKRALEIFDILSTTSNYHEFNMKVGNK